MSRENLPQAPRGRGCRGCPLRQQRTQRRNPTTSIAFEHRADQGAPREKWSNGRGCPTYGDGCGDGVQSQKPHTTNRKETTTADLGGLSLHPERRTTHGTPGRNHGNNPRSGQQQPSPRSSGYRLPSDDGGPRRPRPLFRMQTRRHLPNEDNQHRKAMGSVVLLCCLCVKPRRRLSVDSSKKLPRKIDGGHHGTN